MAKLTDNEKKFITSLAKMPDYTRDKYLEEHPNANNFLRNIFADEEKIQEIEQASDIQLKKAILSSYAAKAYVDLNKTGLVRKYYGKKDMHMLTKSRIDKIIVDNDKSSNVGERRTAEQDKAGDFHAYVMSDSNGIQPGLHTKQLLPEVNRKKIKSSVQISNPKYMNCNSQDELKQVSLKAASHDLLEETNYFGKLCGINENEFLDDFKTIYGKLPEDKQINDTWEYLTEGLTTTLSANECKTIFNIPIRRLMSYTDSEIRADIKEKDNGKTLADYKINNGDNGLTLNYMLAYIRRIGGDKEKDFLDAKLDYFMKIQDNARDEKKDKFNISFTAVNSVYRKYLKYKNK